MMNGNPLLIRDFPLEQGISVYNHVFPFVINDFRLQHYYTYIKHITYVYLYITKLLLVHNLKHTHHYINRLYKTTALVARRLSALREAMQPTTTTTTTATTTTTTTTTTAATSTTATSNNNDNCFYYKYIK